MSGNAKNALFGAKQEAVLTPKEGYEVESVLVINKTTGQAVPFQLEKTCEHPAQWTCSFLQPAGVVSIRPTLKPIMYSVIIEECENCNIVLLEYDDAVEIKMVASGGQTAVPGSGAAEGGVNFNIPQHPSDTTGDADSGLGVEVNGSADTDAPSVTDETAESPAELVRNDTTTEDGGEAAASDVVEPDDSAEDDATADEVGKDGSEVSDSIYDAGEFAEELADFEPEYITQAELDKLNKAYWAHRHAADAGQISKEKFKEVQKKHNQLLQNISTGRVVVRE